jgi:NADP-dependent 3-hydroxy acid dehydrogenase YdfG
MARLSGHIAVVTGASSGVGRAIALALARESATVALVARREAELAVVAQAAREAGGDARSFPTDLGEDSEIAALVEHLQIFPGIDVLVHSAGTYARGPVEEVPVEDLDRQYRINVRAAYQVTRHLLPMLRRRQGQVVFINSSAGLNARQHVSQYASTKHALKALADGLREEVNADGVRVLSVFLGRTATPLQAAIHEMEGRPYRPDRLIQPEDVATVVLSALCLPRTAEVTDISIRPLAKPG